MNKSDFKNEISGDVFEFGALEEALNYRKAVIKEFSNELRGKVIEIGAGIGQMTELLKELPNIEFLQCVEPNSDISNIFKRNFPLQPLINGTIQDIKTDDWNAIISVNVLEHVFDDKAELKIYYEKLKRQNGTLNLFVPARPEIYSTIDKNFGHYRRYAKKEIIKKLTGAGFKIEKVRYFNIIGYFAWWFNFRVMKKGSFDTKSVRLFDKLFFPPIYFLESRIWAPPIGQSLLVIARAK